MCKRIFICDDDVLFPDLIKDVLEEKGFEVEIFSDHLALLTRLVKVTPSLIMLDLQMPEMWGDDLTRIIKGREDTKNTPVILCSSNVNCQKKASICGADDFLLKFRIVEDLERVVDKNLLKAGPSTNTPSNKF